MRCWVIKYVRPRKYNLNYFPKNNFHVSRERKRGFSDQQQTIGQTFGGQLILSAIKAARWRNVQQQSFRKVVKHHHKYIENPWALQSRAFPQQQHNNIAKKSELRWRIKLVIKCIVCVCVLTDVIIYDWNSWNCILMQLCTHTRSYMLPATNTFTQLV